MCETHGWGYYAIYTTSNLHRPIEQPDANGEEIWVHSPLRQRDVRLSSSEYELVVESIPGCPSFPCGHDFRQIKLPPFEGGYYDRRTAKGHGGGARGMMLHMEALYAEHAVKCLTIRMDCDDGKTHGLRLYGQPLDEFLQAIQSIRWQELTPEQEARYKKDTE